MENDNVQKLLLENKTLKKKIMELRKKISSQEVIIDALVSKNRVQKRKLDNTDDCIDEHTQQKKTAKHAHTFLSPEKEIQKEENTRQHVQLVNETENKIEKVNSEECKKNLKEQHIKATLPFDALPGLEQSTSSEEEDVFVQKQILPAVAERAEFIEQIINVFKIKQKTGEFKANFSFKRFVDYCESSYEFSLCNKKISRPKNPLRMYITANVDRIIKYLLDSINTLNLNQICSTLFLINSEIEYRQKQVVFHDLVLELSSYSKLNFIACALFNNNQFENDLFSQIIKKVMYHQICIDYDQFKEKEVSEYLDSITANMALVSPEISLWDSLSHFMVKHQLFDTQKKTIKSDAVEKGFMLRMTCHYLDWEYTYNTFIVTQLFPKIIADRTPIHVYYLGILALNALRLFSEHESVASVLNELESILSWNDDCSVVAYLILKQVKQAVCVQWIDNNVKRIEELGFDILYLKQALLL